MIRNDKRESHNHRGRLDIIADILDASRRGVRRTCLMYQCNLSFKQLKSYMHFMIKQDFLRAIIQIDESRSRSFEVTEKGREFLKAYEGLKSLMQ